MTGILQLIKIVLCTASFILLCTAAMKINLDRTDRAKQILFVRKGVFLQDIDSDCCIQISIFGASLDMVNSKYAKLHSRRARA